MQEILETLELRPISERVERKRAVTQRALDNR